MKYCRRSQETFADNKDAKVDNNTVVKIEKQEK